ncbi:uncharacterized protein F4822DRAFT_432624 [Hypoxylon trugodes]|uniref:uncharacterized protein n=1 Tax=Hypoxylon trugodes TaxID=326681 RepID=UPI00218D8316|nr:uncharacterized protein F4822DRAFT_432624 [Hypoxylon trugodes]KAI1385771.1 hypothetical protein F4822DRAFT_432624 [Hypoxylon trugodes]
MASEQRLAKSRIGRAFANNIEVLRQRGEETRQKYRDKPLNDFRAVSRKLELERERLWNALTIYFQDVQGIDPESIWISLCEGDDISDYVREFFSMFIESSVCERPCVGPEEYRKVWTINSTLSIDEYWKLLLAKAERTVLHRKRMEDPEHMEKWTLTTKIGKRYGLWIEEGAPIEHNLSRKQTFEKKEMTPEDIMILLRTLWRQARHINATGWTRLAFHGAVLISGIGGFRPGEVVNLTYRQVAFELVRDPLDSSRRRLVASITIVHSKQMESRIQRSQHKVLLVARAIADRAFDEDFQSLDDILHRPNMGNLDSLPLSWTPGILDKPILPICYQTYWRMWRRTLQVSGLRDEKQRPYSLRVGAGSRISGSLSEPARHVAQDLVHIAFRQNSPEHNNALFDSLRRSFLQRDPNAPLYADEIDVDAFEKRQDITNLRAQYKEAVAKDSSAHPKAKRIAAQIHYIRHSLAEELLQKKRAEWFDNSDKHRAAGKAVTKESDHDLIPFKNFDPAGVLAAEAVGQFMELEESEYEQGAVKLVNVYLAYLRRHLTEVVLLVEGGVGDKADTQNDDACEKTAIDLEKAHLCLFGCRGFADRKNLTRHNRTVHFEKGDFDRPFPCPECCRLGIKCIIEGPMHWSNHVETVHGRAHAPDLPSSLESRRNQSWREDGQWERCLICGDLFSNAGGFSRHFRVMHLQKQKLFEAPFSCPECAREQVKPICVANETEWLTHLVDAHQGGGRFGPLHSLREPKRLKRSRSAIQGNDSDYCDSKRRKK